MNFDNWLNNKENFSHSLNPSHICDFYTLNPTPIFTIYYTPEGGDDVIVYGPIEPSITALTQEVMSPYKSTAKKIIIGNTITRIEKWAFKDFKVITSITFGENVNYVGEEAFINDNLLNEAILNNKLETIGEWAFLYTGLNNVVIPNSVTSIQKGAYRDCKKLISVYIPDSVTNIEETAFKYCPALQEARLSRSITGIKHETFCLDLYDSSRRYYNLAMTYIVIPEKVEYLENFAFQRYKSLTTIFFERKLAPIFNNIKPNGTPFYDCNDNTTVYIPKGSDYAVWKQLYPTWTFVDTITKSVSFLNMKLEKPTLDMIINCLESVSETQIITLSDFSKKILTDIDKLIITKKGWTIA